MHRDPRDFPAWFVDHFDDTEAGIYLHARFAEEAASKAGLLGKEETSFSTATNTTAVAASTDEEDEGGAAPKGRSKGKAKAKDAGNPSGLKARTLVKLAGTDPDD